MDASGSHEPENGKKRAPVRPQQVSGAGNARTGMCNLIMSNMSCVYKYIVCLLRGLCTNDTEWSVTTMRSLFPSTPRSAKVPVRNELSYLLPQRVSG